MEGRFMHSPDAGVRRRSAVVYCAATGVSTFAFAGWGGLDHLGAARFVDAAGLVLAVLPLWWIAAGIGLRIVARSHARDPDDIRTAR
jgi:hypothetical protein